MAAGNGQNGVQSSGAQDCGHTCVVCGEPETFTGSRSHTKLCASHYQMWSVSQESLRFNEHHDAGRSDAARVAFEDFVRRVRAETLNSGGDRAA